MSHSKSDQAKQQEGFEEAPPSTLSDWLKKAIGAGVNGVFSPEEGGIKSAISDFTLPKEVLALIVTQVDRAKKEVVQVVAREVGRFLENLEIQEIIKKAIAGSTIEINATIKVNHDAQGTIQEHKISLSNPPLKKSPKKTKKSPA